LAARYGVEEGRIQGGGRGASVWWSDIYALCRDSWFSDNVSRSLGNRKYTLFWSDVWIGGVSLRVRFSRLYDLSMFKESFHMSHLGWGEDGCNARLFYFIFGRV